MRVLVTGGSGLLGARLLDRLEANGVEAVSYDLRLDGSDIRDEERLARAMEGCDGVFHLAAVSRVAWGEADPALCRSINVDGTDTVLGAALRMSRRPWFVFTSSREVYGNIGSKPARENDTLTPFNVYGQTKLEGEHLVAEAKARGLRAGIVRLSNVYGGPNDHPDRAVPSLLWHALAGQPLQISGSSTFFDFVHVDDCVEGLLMLAERVSEGASLSPIHLVTGVPTNLGQLAQMCVSLARSGSDIIVQDTRPFDVFGFVGDPAKAAETIGWQARTSLEEGLVRYAEDLRTNGGPPKPVVVPAFGWAETLPDVGATFRRRAAR